MEVVRRALIAGPGRDLAALESEMAAGAERPLDRPLPRDGAAGRPPHRRRAPADADASGRPVVLAEPEEISRGACKPADGLPEQVDADRAVGYGEGGKQRHEARGHAPPRPGVRIFLCKAHAGSGGCRRLPA